jgi:hypothetical protein
MAGNTEAIFRGDLDMTFADELCGDHRGRVRRGPLKHFVYTAFIR